MADCKRCDRCGEFYEYYENESENNRFYNGRANGVCFSFEHGIGACVSAKKKVDLCPECFGDLIRFMNGADVKPSLYSRMYKSEIENPTMEDKNNG